MNQWWKLALAGLLAWGWLGAPWASAQFGGGYTPPQVGPPTFNPFLNLNRGGTNPAINYYGLVRPQQQTMQQLNNLQLQQNLLAAGAGASAPGLLSPDQALPPSTTGHPVRFFDQARYFPLGGLPGSYGTGVVPGVGLGVAPGAGYGAGYGTGFGTTLGAPLNNRTGTNFGLILR